MIMRCMAHLACHGFAYHACNDGGGFVPFFVFFQGLGKEGEGKKGKGRRGGKKHEMLSMKKLGESRSKPCKVETM